MVSLQARPDVTRSYSDWGFGNSNYWTKKTSSGLFISECRNFLVVNEDIMK
jgi:hypothetical protein